VKTSSTDSPRRVCARFRSRSAKSRVAQPVPAAAIALLLLAFLLSSCGYHVAGRGNALPSEWKVIAIPALKNRTSSYRIEQRFTQALVREMISRTKYRVVPDEKDADAVLEGEISSLQTTPVLFDSTTTRATLMLVSVTLRVRLIDRASGKEVYQNNKFVFRNEYEITTDIPSFFQEEGPALDRMARDFARTLVSAVLEKF
jgi:outer membrane lipopolysaccharide assembly protein LptE/RlpB